MHVIQKDPQETPRVPCGSVPSSEITNDPNDYIRQFCNTQNIKPDMPLEPKDYQILFGNDDSAGPEGFKEIFQQKVLPWYFAAKCLKSQNGSEINPHLVAEILGEMEKYAKYGIPIITDIGLFEGKVYYGFEIGKNRFGGKADLYKPNGYRGSCI
jgi:hypothetical protein